MNMQSLHAFIMTSGTSQKHQGSLDNIQIIHAFPLGSLLLTIHEAIFLTFPKMFEMSPELEIFKTIQP